MAIFVGEIGLLPLHNSACGHFRLTVALMQNFVPTASKDTTDMPCAIKFTI
jgi:hypothetical protein